MDLNTLESACETCSLISRILPRFHLDIPEDIKKQNRELAFVWTFQLHKVVASARQGCHFCAFIAHRFFESNNLFTYGMQGRSYKLPSLDNEEARQTAFATALKKSNEFENDTFTFSLTPRHTKGNPLPDLDKMEIAMWKSEMDKPVLDKHMPYRRPITVEVYATKDDPASKYLSTRPINVNLASDESFQQAREWIHDCLHKHPNCPEPATPELPTRVVEILDDGKLRVHDTGGEASYAALSYCRGGIQAFETTLSSLKDRKEGFSMNFLPQTLQDGVKVATELGLRYIWIDSLCIVQDSPADKGKEITQMAQIYSNAYVTICAASAEKASDGFLKILGSTPEEPNASLDDDLIKMPYRAPDGEQGTILIREEAPYHSTWEPTSRRAWTLQERILSPRNLIYGSKLIWQCNTTQHSDGGVEDWSFDILGAGHRKFSSGAFKSTNPPPNLEIDFFTLRQVFQVWYDAVQEYTRRDLSYPSDKLPAMAGMAKAFHSLTGAAYLAGLWKSNLTHDLMWHTHPTVRYAKPATWRAPSWSWASTDNKVSFDKITPDCASLATIISCSVTPISATAPFGEVSDGVLELSAPYIKAAPALVKQMMAEQSMAPPPKENNAQMWNKSIIDMILGGGKDAKGEGAWEPDGSVGCVLLFRREWHWESEYQKRKIEEICYSGVVLAEVGDGSGRYRRVGAFFDQWKDWIAAGGENRSITVI